jgi:hypothetical protein
METFFPTYPAHYEFDECRRQRDSGVVVVHEDCSGEVVGLFQILRLWQALAKVQTFDERL